MCIRRVFGSSATQAQGLLSTLPRRRYAMNTVTPDLASRYIDPAAMAWTATRFPGVEAKVLLEDTERGLLTALVRFAPGATLPDHVHQDIEQSYVLSGSFEDEEGRADAGQFVWRPAGSRHAARSPGGAVVLSVFLAPNRFIGDESGGGTTGEG